MAYTINRYDTTLLISLTDETVDNAVSSLTLIGQDYVGFGEVLNENFVHLLENFRKTTAPDNPLEGQIWYDDSTSALKFYNGSSFVVIGEVTKVGTPVNNQIAIWTGDGPIEGSSGLVFDGSDLGIGQASPQGKLHLTSNSFSPTWGYFSAMELIVERASSTLTVVFACDDDGEIAINFAREDDLNPGAIIYNHLNDDLTFRANDNGNFVWDGNNIKVGNPVGSSKGAVRTVNGVYDYGTSGNGGYAGFSAALSSGGAEFEAYSGTAATDTFCDFNAKDTTSGKFDVRFFRGTNTSGIVDMTLFQGDGTSTYQHRFRRDQVFLSTQAGGKVIIGSQNSPTATLDIREEQEASLALPMLRLFADLGVQQTSLFFYSPQADTGASPWLIDTTSSLEFRIDGTPRLLIDDAGNTTVSGDLTSDKSFSEIWSTDNHKSYYLASSAGVEYYLIGTIRNASSSDGFMNIKIMQSGDFGGNSPGYLEVQVKQRNGTVTMYANRVGSEVTDDVHVVVQTPDASVTINVYAVVDDFGRHPIEIFHDDQSTNVAFIEPTGTADPGDTVLANSDDFIITTADHDGTDPLFGIGTATPVVSLDINSTDAVQMPSGTTGEQPAGAAGMLRFNSSDVRFEGYTTGWGPIAGEKSGITIANTPPGSPSAEDTYWDNELGRQFIYYTDANTSQWVETSPGTGEQGVTGDTGDTGLTGDTGSQGVKGDDGAAGPAGGNGGDEVFWENDILVTTDYTITDGKNAMSAGPVEVDGGVTVTIGPGETWTIV